MKEKASRPQHCFKGNPACNACSKALLATEPRWFCCPEPAPTLVLPTHTPWQRALGGSTRLAGTPAPAPLHRFSQPCPRGASQLQLGDGLQVDDVGAVGQAQGARPRKHVRQRRDVAHAGGAVHLRRAGRWQSRGRWARWARGPCGEARAERAAAAHLEVPAAPAALCVEQGNRSTDSRMGG